jgi:outer membrane protein OmpA-like peptidoglycan-associated protein
MRHLATLFLVSSLAACGGSNSNAPSQSAPAPAASSGSESSPAAAAPSGGSDTEAPRDFEIKKSEAPSKHDDERRKDHASKIRGTDTEAAIKFTVVDMDAGAVVGTVIALTDPNGKKYYTPETDSDGYTEILVPKGQKYDIVFLSLGRSDIAARATVTDEPRQNIRLTLRYKRWTPPPGKPEEEERFVLDGILFDTGKTAIRPESLARLDSVVEYMAHKPSAHIEISGHTDNVGDPKKNKALSEKRAQSCRDYLISKGVDGTRLTAVGYGDEKPIASNDTEEGRKKNRRIEAKER